MRALIGKKKKSHCQFISYFQSLRSQPQVSLGKDLKYTHTAYGIYCSVCQSCLTLCYPMDCSMPGFPVLHHLLELAQIYVHQVNDAIQTSHPLSSASPPAFNLSYHQGLFKWVSFSHQVAKVSSLNFSISPSNEYSGLISFRMDWFDLLAVQGTFKSLLQHHSLKASILQCSELMLFASLHFWIIYLILPIGTQNNVS